ncbi:unnamed protein product [Ostreobium quekettii]|uniref:Uncharacterized protein n=1 Tax=Ostreobium quekettii TaxID=121088 RepID=A0A8S1IZS0_9CHLO|nr:unnamed protein product [Ostreobium quekettii]
MSTGVFAGSVQSFVVTPVDVLKIRLQVQTAVPGQKSYVGAFGMARQIIQRAGVQGLFRGLPVTLLRDTPSHGVYFYVYHHIKDIIESKGHAQCSAVGAPAVGMFLAGGVAGVVSWLSVYPLDVCKSRVQALDRDRSPYKTWVECAAQIYRLEGAAPFWRGLIATLYRAFLVNAAIFTAYESCMSGLNA